MKIFIIYGDRFTSKAASYDYLASVFHFPSYFGNNLDALWDCLSDLQDAQIEMINARMIPRNLGEYGMKLLDVFGDLEQLEGITVHFSW